MDARKRGFTLVEILVASVIGAFIAFVSVSALRTVSASAEMLDRNISTSSEARFAAQMIARDLMNLHRDGDVKGTKLVGQARKTGAGFSSYLCLHTVGRTKARIDQPEGEVYEVEYYVRHKDERRGLMRRLWPNPDKESVPGGILTLIAEDIDVFEVQYFDGEDWQLEWPEEMKSLPELIEVIIVASRGTRADTAFESFIVNLPRAPWPTKGGSTEDEGS